MGRGQPSNYSRADASTLVSAQDYKDIIDADNVDALVAAAERVGKAIARDVKNNQIRGIFATVRQVQLNWATNPKKASRDAMLLKPRIGYAASRNELAGLDKVLIEALNRVSSAPADSDERKARFSRFMDFFEAIVAYHKMNGGRDR